MKTLIIENQYTVDPEIEAFLEDNPELFESEPTKIIGARSLSSKQLEKEIDNHEALVVKSTFMDKDQLEGVVTLLALKKGKKIYVHYLEDSMEQWVDPERSNWGFGDYPGFIENLKKIFQGHELYDWEEDHPRDIEDQWSERMSFATNNKRGRFTPKRFTHEFI